MQSRTLLGVLTPSSNTRLEPLTAAMLSATPSVTAHFSRFRVVDVGLGAAAQFDPGRLVEAAGLLALSLGLSRMRLDDLEQLASGMTLYDAFYRWARDARDETHEHDRPTNAPKKVVERPVQRRTASAPPDPAKAK